MQKLLWGTGTTNARALEPAKSKEGLERKESMTAGKRFPLILKLIVFCLSGEFVRIFSKSPVLFGLGFIVGSSLQIAIPPRKVGWRPMLPLAT